MKVESVLELELIKGHILIVGAPHTKAHEKHKKPPEILREGSKALCKTIDRYSEDVASDFSNKPQEDTLEAELVYTEKLTAVIEKHEERLALPASSQKFNDPKEALEDDLERLEVSAKEEARTDHKEGKNGAKVGNRSSSGHPLF